MGRHIQGFIEDAGKRKRERRRERGREGVIYVRR